jgi:hypothetical protein
MVHANKEVQECSTPLGISSIRTTNPPLISKYLEIFTDFNFNETSIIANGIVRHKLPCLFYKHNYIQILINMNVCSRVHPNTQFVCVHYLQGQFSCHSSQPRVLFFHLPMDALSPDQLHST